MPALITDHGHPLHDSRVICEYLAHRAGRHDLLPDEPVKRFRVLTLQSQALGVADAGVAWRYEMVMRPEALRWQKFAERQKTRAMMALDDAEANWTDLFPRSPSAPSRWRRRWATSISACPSGPGARAGRSLRPSRPSLPSARP